MSFPPQPGASSDLLRRSQLCAYTDRYTSHLSGQEILEVVNGSMQVAGSDRATYRPSAVPRTPRACKESSHSTRSSLEALPRPLNPRASFSATSTGTWLAGMLRSGVSVMALGYTGSHLADGTTALVHVIGGLLALNYANDYYFHLREYHPPRVTVYRGQYVLTCRSRPPQEQRPLDWSLCRMLI